MGDVRVGACVLDATLQVAELACDGLKLAAAKTLRADASDGFEFTLRAPRAIIREGFRDGPVVRRVWKDALELANALDARVIVFATPAGFRPGDESIASLGRFADWAHRGRIRLAWAPHGDAWAGDLLWKLCRELAITHAVDPLRTMCVRPRPAYFRLNGYRGRHDVYADDQLRRVRAMCTAAVTYCVFGNGKMVADAQRFGQLATTETTPTSARSLRFEKLGDILADVDGLASGPVKATGNWTPAQIVKHVADGIEHPEVQPQLPSPDVAWGDAVSSLRSAIEHADQATISEDLHCRHAERHFGFLERG